MELASSNRRRCVRQKLHSPAYVSTGGNSPASLLDLSKIYDISIRGLSFQGQTQLKSGERVSLRLDFSETGDSIQTSGRVAWSEPSGRTGVRFRKIPRPAFRRLKEWLFLNVIAACVHYQAAQGRTAQSGLLPETEAVARTVSDTWLTGVEIPDSTDYATVLITLTAIRRDVEACGAHMQLALQRLVEHACTVVCASGAAVAVSNGRDMVCRASAGANVPSLGARIGVGAGFSGECIRSGRLLRCDDAETDPLVDSESCRVLGIRSIMAVPACYGDTVIGLLEVFSPQPAAFRWKDEVYLRRLAEIAVASINRAVRAVGGAPTSAEILAVAANARIVEPDPLGFGLAHSSGGRPVDVEPGGFEPRDYSIRKSEVPASSVSTRFRNIALAAAAAAVLVLAALLLVRSVRRRTNIGQNLKKHLVSAGAAPKKSAAASTPAEELERLRQQAEEGDAIAQFAFGARYATGEDVVQDYGEAARWFSLAAEQGHVTAQATLGAYYWLGRGVPQDFDKAYFWSILAKAGGDEASKYRIPALASHLSREEIIADQEQANDWIKQHQMASQDSHSSSSNSKD